MKSTFKSYSWLVLSGAMLVGVSTQAAPASAVTCMAEECGRLAKQAEKSIKNFCESAAKCVGVKFIEEAPVKPSAGKAALSGGTSLRDAPAMTAPKSSPLVEAKPVASVPAVIPGSRLEGALAPTTKFVRELSPGAKVYKVKSAVGLKLTPAEKLLNGMVEDLERAKKLAKETGEPIPGFSVFVVEKGDLLASKNPNNLGGNALVDESGVLFTKKGLATLNEKLTKDPKTGRKLSLAEENELGEKIRKDLCVSCGYCPTGKDVSGRILPAAGH